MTKLTTGLVATYIGLTWLAAAALHLLTVWIAYNVAGFWGTLLTFSLPPMAEIYWFLRIWHNATLFHPYNVACMVVLILSLPVAFVSELD